MTIRIPPRASSRTPIRCSPGGVMEKDTITFAVLLSVIDFILSMVMISGIGVVLSLLPLLNRLGKLDEDSMRRGH
jgi:hypothetical protein